MPAHLILSRALALPDRRREFSQGRFDCEPSAAQIGFGAPDQLRLTPLGTVRLETADGTALLEVDYIHDTSPQSLTLSPDLNDRNHDPIVVQGHLPHSTVSPDGALFSPGTRLDGTDFDHL